jgi:hypothetical protein
MFFVVGMFIFPGILLWVIAVVLFVRQRSGGRGGVDVLGEVYEHRGYISRGQQMYVPRYRAVVNGQTLTCDGTTATNWKRPPVGTQVKLVHVPADAETPLRERGLPMGILVGVILLTVFGTGFLVMGTLAIVSHASPSDDPAKAEVHAPSPKRSPGRRP